MLARARGYCFFVVVGFVWRDLHTDTKTTDDDAEINCGVRVPRPGGVGSSCVMRQANHIVHLWWCAGAKCDSNAKTRMQILTDNLA